MLKSIFVPLLGNDEDIGALRNAFNIARCFNAHLDCLHIRRDMKQILIEATMADSAVGIGGGMILSDVIRAFEQADKARSESAKQTFARLCESEQIEILTQAQKYDMVSGQLREVSGFEDDLLVPEARMHDVTVLGSSSSKGHADGRFATDILLGSGKPIILSPGSGTCSKLDNIAIAWKDTAESARAVAASMPILEKARQITIITIGEGDDPRACDRTAEGLKTSLLWHGLSPQTRHVERCGTSVHNAISNVATELDADLLVMGGYGHSRLNEFVFGGMTRQILADPFMLTFMMH